MSTRSCNNNSPHQGISTNDDNSLVIESVEESTSSSTPPAPAPAPAPAEHDDVKQTEDFNNHRKYFERDNILIIMCGLPARGKSFLSRKICGYYHWLGYNAQLFNVGNLRRKELQGQRHDASFFDTENTDAKLYREHVAMLTLNKALDWLCDPDNHLAILDATNTTVDRRNKIRNAVTQRRSNGVGIHVVYVESICTDASVIAKNVLQKIANSPDFVGMNPEVARQDLMNRIRKYEDVYEPIDEDEGPNINYIKLINLQRKVICFGDLPPAIIGFLMANHTVSRPIWFTRSGHCDVLNLEKQRKNSLQAASVLQYRESESTLTNNVSSSRILHSKPTSLSNATRGVNLSNVGKEYARRLSDFIKSRSDELGMSSENCHVFTSTLPRAMQTISNFKRRSQQRSSLCPLDTGIAHGWSLDAVHEYLPDEFERYMRDPFNCRFPGGESCSDLVTRLDGLLIELERSREPCIIVSHLSTLKILYGYFIGKNREESLELQIPPHTVIELLSVPEQYGWQETRFNLMENLDITGSMKHGFSSLSSLATMPSSQYSDSNETPL